MFGYVKPYQPELRVKELEAYKAVYCGLCGQLGHSFGPVAQLTLSYDFTFLCMLYWAVADEAPKAVRGRCYVNPLKKLTMCAGGEGSVLSADIAIIMLYYKLLDNIRDSRFFSSAAWSLLRPFAGRAYRKAAARRPEQAALVAEGTARQAALEKAGESSIDAACEPTAAMLGGIFRLLSAQDNQRRVLERIGYLLGRYIYLCDALDDLSGDVRAGRYNPIALRHGLADGGDWHTARVQAVQSLLMTIGELEKTLALLALHDFVPQIENIVTMGLRASVEEIQARAGTADGGGALSKETVR